MALAKSLLFAASRSSAPKVKSKPITLALALAEPLDERQVLAPRPGGRPKRAMLFSSMATITTCGLGVVPRNDCQRSRSTRSGRLSVGATCAPTRSRRRTPTAPAAHRRSRRRAISLSSKSRLPRHSWARPYASRAGRHRRQRATGRCRKRCQPAPGSRACATLGGCRVARCWSSSHRPSSAAPAARARSTARRRAGPRRSRSASSTPAPTGWRTRSRRAAYARRPARVHLAERARVPRPLPRLREARRDLRADQRAVPRARDRAHRRRRRARGRS